MINNLLIQVEQRVEKLLTNPSPEHLLVLKELLKGMAIFLKDSKQNEVLSTINQFLEFIKNNFFEESFSLSEELASTIRNFVSQLKNQLTEEPKAVVPEQPKQEEPKAVVPEQPKQEEPKAVAPEEPKQEEPKAVAPEQPKQEEPKAMTPDVSKDEGLDAEMEELQAEYLKTLPEKISEMERLIAAFVNQPEEKSKEELKRAVHKLAGSAGSFGFMQVTEMCRAMEQELGAVSDFANIDPWKEKLSAFFMKLKEAFEKKKPQ